MLSLWTPRERERSELVSLSRLPPTSSHELLDKRNEGNKERDKAKKLVIQDEQGFRPHLRSGTPLRNRWQQFQRLDALKGGQAAPDMVSGVQMVRTLLLEDDTSAKRDDGSDMRTLQG